MQMRPAVLRCVVVASSFSLLLGYDIGIMSGAKRLIRKDFALSDPQARRRRRVRALSAWPGSLAACRGHQLCM